MDGEAPRDGSPIQESVGPASTKREASQEDSNQTNISYEEKKAILALEVTGLKAQGKVLGFVLERITELIDDINGALTKIKADNPEYFSDEKDSSDQTTN